MVKKLKKRISAILLSAVMIFSLGGTSTAAGVGATKENGWTTTDTLTSVTGKSEEEVYSAEWMLANENAFAWGGTVDDTTVGFSHMVGPAMSNGKITANGGSNNYLTNGYNYFHAPNNGRGDLTTLLYPTDQTLPKNPFYVGTQSIIEEVGEGFKFDERMVPSGTAIYKTDGFVDFNQAGTILQAQSDKIYDAANKNSATVKITKDNMHSYIKSVGGFKGIVIDIGTTVVIDDEVIDAMQKKMIDNAFILNGNFLDSKATVINISKTGKFTMPATYVFDGDTVMRDSSMLQDHYKYNENLHDTYRSWFNTTGTNVVWNMTQATDIVFSQSAGTDMMGHMFAPQANITGGCGSVNGGFVCKSVNLPQTEAHMYPMSANITPSDLIEPPVTAVVKANKTLTMDGAQQTLLGNEFAFQLDSKSENAKIVHQEKKNNDKGEITFDTLSFNRPGEYIYTLKEIKGTDPQITYDDKIYEVKITITKGNSEAKIEYSGDNGISWKTETPVFNNIKEKTEIKLTPVKAQIKAKKELRQASPTGQIETLEGKDFSFDLYEIKDSTKTKIQNINNDAKGNVIFKEITYAEPGIYKYKIQETDGKITNIVYDKAEYDVEVKVTKVKNKNELKAEITYVNNVNKKHPPVFVNVHEYNPANINIEASKKLFKGNTTEEEKLNENDFSFILTPYTSNPGDEKPVITRNDQLGNVIFAKNYYEIGKYQYTLVENTNNKQPGVTYDAKKYIVTVEVTAGIQDDLIATVTYKEAGSNQSLTTMPVFKNKKQEQKLDSTTALIQAKKVLKDSIGNVLSLENDKYSFKLIGTNGTVIDSKYDTAKNKADGSIEFEVPYTKEGNYTYTLQEETGSLSDITYDKNQYKIIVEVTKVDRSLAARVIYLDSKPGNLIPVFTNTKNLPAPQTTNTTIKATKKIYEETLSGKSELAGTDAYSFTIKGISDNTEKKEVTIKNGANGVISYTTENYTAPGDYVYELSEIAGSDKSMEYDKTKYQVTVKVELRSDNTLNVKEVEYKNLSSNTVLGKNGTPEFKNIKKKPAAVQVQVKAKKEVKDSNSTDISVLDKFTFKLEQTSPAGSQVYTQEIKGSGNIIFDPIEYTKVGTYTYTLKEIDNNDGKYDYDQNEYTVEVKVEEKEGALVPTLTYKKDGNVIGNVVFTNIKKPQTPAYTPIKVDVKAQKVLQSTEKTLQNSQFSFGLKQNQVDINKPAVNDASGNIVFKLDFNQPGTYTYEIYEKVGNDKLIIYDQTIYKVEVNVTADTSNILSAELRYYDKDGQLITPEKVKFINVRKEGTISKEVEVKWEGDTPENRPIDVQVQLKKDGENEGGVITITPGSGKWEHEWTDLPKYNPQTGEEYEYTVEQVPVPPSYNEKSNEVDQTNKDKIVITNIIYAPIESTVVANKKLHDKTLTGSELDMTAGQFEFTLKETADTSVAPLVSKNTDTGNVEFKISHNQKGVYQYVLEEKKLNDSNITYDTTSYKVTVTVTDKDNNGKLEQVVTYAKADGSEINEAEVVFHNIKNEEKVEPQPEPTPQPDTDTTVPDNKPTPQPETDTTVPDNKPTPKPETESAVPDKKPSVDEENSTPNKKPQTEEEENDSDKLNAQDEEEENTSTETDSSAKTGDSMNPFVWILLMLSAAGTCILLFLKKKSKNYK